MRIAIVTGASSGMGREFVKQVSKKEKFGYLIKEF
jgi:short-subunit dehydrogenase